MSRKYVKIDEHGKEILELKRAGKTNREIAQMLDVDKECIRNWVFRFNRQQRKLEAGIKLRPKGRPRKDAQPRDIVAEQAYEFDHNNYKHKDFPLLSEKSHFTDDTVMTAAVAVGLIDGKGLPERTFCAVQHEMRFWGREYPHAGYGGMFRGWLHTRDVKYLLLGF